MKLGLQLGYWQASPPPDLLEMGLLAEDLGFDCLFTAESWGSDVFTPLAWIGGAHQEDSAGHGDSHRFRLGLRRRLPCTPSPWIT